jgi:hypothetical protein
MVCRRTIGGQKIRSSMMVLLFDLMANTPKKQYLRRTVVSGE